MPVLEVEGVTKRFMIPTVRRQTVREHVLGLLRPAQVEALQVLDGVTFSVERGETFGIMGRNGCGKSTLLKIIAGIYRADAGEVRAHAPVTPVLELGVGWNTELNAVDNIQLVGTVMGLSLAELKAATPAILDFAGLARFAQLEVRHYSSGMAARLAFAVAFLAVREVLVLDEIYAVGDAEFQRRCMARFAELRAAGKTIVIVSHQVSDIAELCDRAVLLEGGRVTAEGPGREVAAAYQRLLAGGTVDGVGVW